MSRETTRELAEFAAALRLEDVPVDVRDSAKALLLDALACAFAGHEGEETGQIGALASALGSSPESVVVGGEPMSLAGAVLMNGYLITAVTMCDVHRATLTHVTPEIVPPALAIAARDDASGADLLAALVAGLEVTTRIGLGLDYPAFRKRGWHGPGVIGPFGAAAAVGRLRGFDADTMARAFGLAGSQSAGTFAAWGTPTVKWHQCRAALSGLMAALLAEQDFAAARNFLTAPDGGLFSTYAEGGLPELATRDLGRHWELQRISLRLWPAATALQDVLTALAGLEENIAFGDIARVRLALPKTAFDMHGGFSTYRAKFEALLSAHYVAAVYLRDRTLTLDRFEPACYDDPGAPPLRRRTGRGGPRPGARGRPGRRRNRDRGRRASYGALRPHAGEPGKPAVARAGAGKVQDLCRARVGRGGGRPDRRRYRRPGIVRIVARTGVVAGCRGMRALRYAASRLLRVRGTPEYPHPE